MNLAILAGRFIADGRYTFDRSSTAKIVLPTTRRVIHWGGSLIFAISMKLVTQKRVLKALDNLYRLTHDNKVMQQTSAFALHGLKSHFGTLQEIDNDRLNLELQLIERELPKNVEDFSAKFDHLMNVVDKRRSKIHDIQIKHGVSGLEWRKINDIEFPFFEESLRPLAIDMLKLSEFKAYIVRHWIDYSVSSGLTPHLHSDSGWESMSFDRIWEISCGFDWANIWIDKHYLSRHLLNTQGFDSPRNEARYPDDRLYIEFHLTLGRGENHSSIDSDTLWFCAATEDTL